MTLALSLITTILISQTGTATRTLTLDEALATAKKNPQLASARAQIEAARARTREVSSAFWPQASATASYSIGNSIRSSGGGGIAGLSSDVNNFFLFGLSANQLIWDFGQTTGRRNAAEASASAQEKTAQSTSLDVSLNVRAAYFDARAQKALVEVGKETLANQERHLEQIKGFVEVGIRPEIDVAQARTDVANARVQLINAENGYATAKATLNQAMGIAGSTDYEVASETLSPLSGEELGTEEMMKEALAARPELGALEEQARAQRLTIDSIKGQYWPALGASASANEAGTDLSALNGTWTLGVALTWSFFEGGITRARVEEASATLTAVEAQIETLRQSVRLDVERARLSVVASKAALAAADEAVSNAKIRLQLAEGRYQTGVGNIIELGDAQLALTGAQAQRVQADFNLSASRARLLRALGRT